MYTWANQPCTSTLCLCNPLNLLTYTQGELPLHVRLNPDKIHALAPPILPVLPLHNPGYQPPRNSRDVRLGLGSARREAHPGPSGGSHNPPCSILPRRTLDRCCPPTLISWCIATLHYPYAPWPLPSITAASFTLVVCPLT